VTVGIDSSGSFNEEMFRKFLSEVYGIVQQFQTFELEFFCWDAHCYTLHRFTEDNGEDILHVELEGGGGNDGVVFVWEFLKENEIVPDNMIMFTDGYIFGPWDNGTPPEFADNTLWVMWGKEHTPPWGDHVVFEDL
jgi:predicted metal-dependent peptidase